MNFSVGNCFQHGDSSEMSISLYLNTTKLKNYINATGSPVDPYIRELDTGFYPGCLGYYPPCNGWSGSAEDGDYLNRPYKPCYVPVPEELACPATASARRVYQGNIYNCFETEATGMRHLGNCHKVGYKNVQAMVLWHGSHGYFHTENLGPAYVDYGFCFPWYADQSDNIDKIRYQRKTAVASLTVTGTGGSTTDEWFTSERTCTVNRYSGRLDRTCTEASSSTSIDFIGGWLYQYSNLCHWTRTMITSYGDSYPNSLFGVAFAIVNDIEGTLGFPPTRTYYGGSHWKLYWEEVGVRSYEVEYNFETGYLHRLEKYLPGGTTAWDETWHYQSDSHFRYTFRGNTYNPLDYIEMDVDVYFENPVTSTNMIAEANEMLSSWDLTNYKIYPWRTDTNTSYAPLVRRDSPRHSIGVDVQCGNSSENTSSTGTLLGQPMDYHYEKYWSFNHENWELVECAFPATWTLMSYGGWSGQHGTPTCATEWTDDYTANIIPKGAFYYFDGDILFAQKWAETLIRRPSINYYRPCGTDRFQISSTGYCIVNVTGTTVNGNPSVWMDEINTGDQVYLCVAGAQRGIYEVTKVDNTTLNLDTLLVSGSQMPDNMYECGTGMVAKLRWPLTYPGHVSPICGRIPISNIVNNTPLTCSLGDTHYLVDNDQIRIAGIPNNHPANGTWTIKVMEDGRITLNGSTTTAVPYKQGGYVYNVYGPDYKWNDDTSKGTYTVVEWDHEYKQQGEADRMANQYDYLYGTSGSGGSCSDPDNLVYYHNPYYPHVTIREAQALRGLPSSVEHLDCTQGSASISPCYPYVVCISPNGEAWKSGITYPMQPITIDERNGSLWQASVEQSIADPFWQRPPCKCQGIEDLFDPEIVDYKCSYDAGLGGGHREDDGTCQQDDSINSYYAHRPMVETICKPPEDAPLPPDGIYFGFLTQEEITAQASGNFYSNPTDSKPWDLYLKQIDCVCNQGRFWEQYHANDVNCDTIQTVEAGI